MSKSVKSVKSEPVTHTGTVFIPLYRLIKSPDNVRKTPHSAATLASLRASIAAKGILQNLIVKPEVDDAGTETGFYFVTAGEGRRLAQIARAKDGEIAREEPMPCVIRETDDASEVSLDENVTREAMHPADQYEAFRALNVERGMDAADIAARFGVSEQIVKQRLRLGAVSPRLMQEYRDENLTLNQLMAFAITEDHARQEAVFDRLTTYREPYQIRRLLTENQVHSEDRRARLIGLEAYEAAGGTVERDLFTEEGGGYLTDVGLLDTLVQAHLLAVANGTKDEMGWKWADAYVDFPYGLGLGRVYPQPRELTADEAAALAQAADSYDALEAEYAGVEELPDDIDKQLGALEAEIERLNALKEGFTPEDLARGGVIVWLNRRGEPEVEYGLIRPEDEVPEPEPEPEEEAGSEDRLMEGRAEVPEDDGTPTEEADEPIDDTSPLSDVMIRDLTTHRTQALRFALAEQPELAARFLVHKLTLDTFYNRRTASCLDLSARGFSLLNYADGLDESPATQALSQRHDAWAASLPDDPADLWPHIHGLDAETLGALMAHCTALTVSAVVLPHQDRAAHHAARIMAQYLRLDMNEYWRPNARSYFNRVTEGQILSAVRAAVNAEEVERIKGWKKPDMAAAAELLVQGTGWLPSWLWTPPMPDPEIRAPETLALPAPDAEADAPEPPVLPEAAE